MIAALIASIAANVALVVVFTRLQAAERAAITAERQFAAAERADLAQRIQAPEQAVLEHALSKEPIYAPRAVSEFDDADHWDAQGLSREQLAEMAMSQELARA